MVTSWKVVLIVVAIGILFMAIGMWLGYRYISEQDDIRYDAQDTTPNTVFQTVDVIFHHFLVHIDFNSKQGEKL